MGEIDYGHSHQENETFLPADYDDGYTKPRPPKLGTGFVPDDDDNVF
jgi:hypothetical protein